MHISPGSRSPAVFESCARHCLHLFAQKGTEMSELRRSITDLILTGTCGDSDMSTEKCLKFERFFTKPCSYCFADLE